MTNTSNPAETEIRRVPTEIRRLLLVDADRDIVVLLPDVEPALTYEVLWVRSSHRVLTAVEAVTVDLLLINFASLNTSGPELLRDVLARQHSVPVVVIGGSSTDRDAMNALDRQRLHVLSAPVNVANLSRAIRLAISNRVISSAGDTAHNRTAVASADAAGARHGTVPAAQRWAGLVMTLVYSTCDLRTIDEWSRCAGVSRTALCECCRLVHVAPRDARDFARMLRAIYHCRGVWQPEAALDVADVRTLGKLLRRGGPTVDHGGQAPTADRFLATQQWLPRDNAGLAALRVLLDACVLVVSIAAPFY